MTKTKKPRPAAPATLRLVDDAAKAVAANSNPKPAPKPPAMSPEQQQAAAEVERAEQQRRWSACAAEINAALAKHRCMLVGVLEKPQPVGDAVGMQPTCVQLQAGYRLVLQA